MAWKNVYHITESKWVEMATLSQRMTGKNGYYIRKMATISLVVTQKMATISLLVTEKNGYYITASS